ncbi:MAG: histidinol phosphate phosphatase domain-containing protein [Candidatus Omnitrophica bacterium]|jgi:histidinol phosphatase-like PHP family hydrolase|nr:histidinol phosphate phosphatase domain-containing protein [Candidatus Omnitrophota bacterium]
MYNLHCHSLLSDGALLPSELAVRHLHAGYKVIAITDHADYSNIKEVTKAILNFTRHWPKNSAITVLPGIELTHLPPEQFRPLVRYSRKQGIKIIVGHGETPAEPVAKGINHAALMAGVDILAHPGMINDDDIKLAIEKNIFLELTARKGHCDTNTHVAQAAIKNGANLILNTDAHAPADIITPDELKQVGLKAGLSEEQIREIYKTTEKFLKAKGGIK